MSRNPGRAQVDAAAAPGLLPVTVLAGYFGAGKSAVIRRALAHRGAEQWALLVNDRSGADDGVDRLEGVETFPYGEAMVELTDQCRGCSLREGLTEAIVAIARLGRFDRLIIECSGLTEPVFVAEMFNEALEEGGEPASVARLDQIVTVVDAATLWAHVHVSDAQPEGDVAGAAKDAQAVSELLIDQIEQGTVLVLNKVDRVSRVVENRLAALLRLLNPEAVVLRGAQGAVPVHAVLAARPHADEPISFQPGWLKVVEGAPMPVVHEVGWTARLFYAARPFHPGRLWAMIGEEWPGVVRVKGYFWIASQPERCLLWAQTVGARRFEWVGAWWMATPEAEWPADEEFRKTLQKDWTAEFGDRRQVLACTGYRMDFERLAQRLQACLLTPSELLMGEEEWMKFEDPFVLATQEAGSFDEDGGEEGE